MLASCGKDQTAIIWDVERRGQSGSGSDNGTPGGGGAGGAGSGSRHGSVVVRRHVLRGHSGPIAFLCWSPDDSKLATCGELMAAWSGGPGRRGWIGRAGFCDAVQCILRCAQPAGEVSTVASSPRLGLCQCHLLCTLTAYGTQLGLLPHLLCPLCRPGCAAAVGHRHWQVPGCVCAPHRPGAWGTLLGFCRAAVSGLMWAAAQPVGCIFCG